MDHEPRCRRTCTPKGHATAQSERRLIAQPPLMPFALGGLATPWSYLQAPVDATETPLVFAAQALEYVLPSQPHTGATSAAHAPGVIVQAPVPSALPQAMSGGKSQKKPVLQVLPSSPPQVVVGAAAQAPVWSMDAPATVAWQSLL